MVETILQMAGHFAVLFLAVLGAMFLANELSAWLYWKRLRKTGEIPTLKPEQNRNSVNG